MVRWILRLVVIFVVVVAVVVGAVFMLPKDRLAQIAGDQLTKTLGRTVTFQGAATPSLYPTLGIAVDGIEIAGHDSTDAKPLLTADGVTLAVDIMSLIRGRLAVRDVVVQSPDINLERAADGGVNWQLAPGQGAGETDTSNTDTGGTEVSIDQIVLSDARLRFADAQTGQSFLLQGADITLALPEQRPATANVSGLFQGQSVSIDAEVADLAALTGGEDQSLMLTASVGRAKISLNGQANVQGRFAGRVDADLTDLNALLAVAGQPAVTLPDGIKSRLAVAGNVVASAASVALSDADITVGSNTVTGDLAASLDDTPFVRANLATPRLDLTPFMGASSRSGPAAGTGWNTTPIDLSALASMNADVQFRAGSVDLGSVDLGTTQLAVTLDRSRLVLGLTQVDGFGGSLSGQLVANNRNGLSVGGDVTASNVSLQQLLTTVAGFEKLRASGPATIEFLGVGASVDAIMNSLSGTSSLAVGSGVLDGIDLAQLFGGARTAGGGTTVFDQASASFNIADGVAKNADLSIVSQAFTATGQGQIALGAQTLDYLFQPTVFAGTDQSISVPVRVRGPWSGPSIFPDLEFLAQQELAAQEAALRAEAEARIEEEKQRLQEQAQALEQQAKDQAADALGLDVQDGQSLEDAARDKIEQELQRGLGNLLGGN
ncbi:MAG: AsmA family protein [Pseudomonadota bacterium]